MTSWRQGLLLVAAVALVQALMATAAQAQVAGRHSVTQCQAYAQQRALDSVERTRFVAMCTGGNAPMEQIEQRARDASARTAAVRSQDDAQYPRLRVQSDVRSGCTAYNQSGVLVLDCACMVREADRHLAEGRLSRRAIAQKEFDSAPCIERRATADKWIERQFQPGAVSMLRSAGVNVDAQKACTHQAIAEGMPRESLTSFEHIRAELKHRCVARR